MTPDGRGPESQPTSGAGNVIGLPEAAAQLGVHYMTAYRYVRTGRLLATSVGGVWRVDRNDVLALVDHRGASPRVQGGSRSRAAARFEQRLLAGDGPGAFTVCEEAIMSWATPVDVYADLVVPAMRSIGDLWSKGEISVAVEHRATTAVTAVMGRLGPQFAQSGRKRGTIVVGAPAGDRHAIPVTVVSDMLRAVHFEVIDLGADTPPESFVEAALASDRMVAVAIGATLLGTGPAVAEAVEAVHTAAPGTPVIIGGAGVPTESTAAQVGADQWSGTDGRRLVELVTGCD